MDLTTFSGALAWIMAHGYALMFVAMLIEGPVVTAAASFAAAQGVFSIWIVFALAILGDLVADIIYFGLGYYTRLALIEKYGARFGMTKERTEKIQGLVNAHAVKTIVAIKLTPLIPAPGLMAVGATRMPIKKFALICLVITLPKVLIFMTLGYYFGHLYAEVSRYTEYAQYLIVVAVIAVLIIRYFYQKLTEYLAKDIKEV